MMGYYAHFVHTQGDEMINSSYNSRQKLLNAKNYRGTIYSADLEKLAETVVFESGTCFHMWLDFLLREKQGLRLWRIRI